MSPWLPGCVFGYLWPASSVHIGADGVVGPCPTHIQVGPVPRLNQTDEVSTFSLREAKTKPSGIRDLGKKKKRKKRKTLNISCNGKKGYITYNAPLMVNNPSAWLKTITSIISTVGCLVFGSSVLWLSVSAWPGLHIRPHCRRENVSKHHITVWQKPRKAVHLSCQVRLRLKPIQCSVGPDNWKTFWLDQKKLLSENVGFYRF